ncbi:MAG: bifunctional precorrin-2 dehydrogenase/sirohydrochlorin ferrochelatase [Bacteroidota bacterium]
MNQNDTRNPLYPVFLKLHRLKMLIVGAGEVGYEKLFFILKSSPQANITVVATWVNPELSKLLEEGDYNVTVNLCPFDPKYIDGHDLVIAATNDRALNEQVQQAAKAKGKLINVADTPDLCDFYLGSIVTRGPLKVAISTNGQSPTFAKRFRQMLEEILPVEVEDLIGNLKVFRDRLVGDFDEKVKKLNDVTASLLEKEEEQKE